MASIASRIPTFTRAACAIGRVLWRPPYRRIFGWGFTGLVVFVFGYNLREGWRWAGYRKVAVTRGVAIDLPEQAPVPDTENLAAAGGPFAPLPLGSSDAIPVDAHGKRWLDFSGISVYGPDLDNGKRMTIEEAYGPSSFMEHEKNASDGTRSANAEAMPYPHTAEEFLRFCDEHFSSTWPAILSAEAKPRVQYPFTPHQLPQTRIPAAMFRMACQLHGQRALAYLELGRSDEARGEIEREFRLVRVMENHGAPGNLVEYMIGTAITYHAIDRVWEGLVDQRWSEADLVTLRDDLASMDRAAGWVKAINGERAWDNIYCDRLALGSLKTRAFIFRGQFDPSHKANVGLFWLAGSCFPSGMARENQVVINELLDKVVGMISSDGRWHPEVWDYDAFAPTLRRPDLFISAIATPSCARAACRAAATEARLRQASLAIGLERYRQRHGELPERIEDLVPEFVAAIPEDPVDGRPIRYVRDSGESYRLLCSAESPVTGAPHLSDVVSIPKENGANLVWPGLGLERKAGVAVR